MTMKLREFKALSLSKLMRLAKELKAKYPEKKDRIEYIVNTLAIKLQQLRTFTLTDYLFTLYLASKEFPEFSALLPDPKVIEELIEAEDE